MIISYSYNSIHYACVMIFFKYIIFLSQDSSDFEEEENNEKYRETQFKYVFKDMIYIRISHGTRTLFLLHCVQINLNPCTVRGGGRQAAPYGFRTTNDVTNCLCGIALHLYGFPTTKEKFLIFLYTPV